MVNKRIDARTRAVRIETNGTPRTPAGGRRPAAAGRWGQGVRTVTVRLASFDVADWLPLGHTPTGKQYTNHGCGQPRKRAFPLAIYRTYRTS